MAIANTNTAVYLSLYDIDSNGKKMKMILTIASGAPMIARYGLNLPRRVLVLSTILPRMIWKTMLRIVCTVSMFCKCIGRMPIVDANRVFVTPRAIYPSRYMSMFWPMPPIE